VQTSQDSISPVTQVSTNIKVASPTRKTSPTSPKSNSSTHSNSDIKKFEEIETFGNVAKIHIDDFVQAARDGQLSMVQEMLPKLRHYQHGMNEKDAYGQSAFIAAQVKGHRDIIDFLRMQSGIDCASLKLESANVASQQENKAVSEFGEVQNKPQADQLPRMQEVPKEIIKAMDIPRILPKSPYLRSLNTTLAFGENDAVGLEQARNACKDDLFYRNKFLSAARLGKFHKLENWKLDMDHSYMGQNGSKASNTKGQTAMYLAKVNLLNNHNIGSVVPKHKAEKVALFLTKNLNTDEEYCDFMEAAKIGNLEEITKWMPIIADLKKQNIKKGEKIILDALYYATEPLWDMDKQSAKFAQKARGVEQKKVAERSSGSQESEKKFSIEQSEFAQIKAKSMPTVLFMVKQKELNSFVTSPWANCSQFMPRMHRMFPEIFNVNEFVDAASSGDLQAVKRLAPQVAINMFLQNIAKQRKKSHGGGPIEEQELVIGQNALMAAASNGHKEVLEFLLQQPDIDVNAVDAEGETAFMKATRNHQTEICRLFLNRKSHDLTQKNVQLGVGITAYANEQPALMKAIAKTAHKRMKSVAAKNMGHSRFKSLNMSLKRHGQNPSISDSEQTTTVTDGAEECC
jgi:hypothetical protein